MTLDIEEGEIAGLIGESGSGKSTLGFAIPRLIPPPGSIRSGKINLCGVDILSLRDSELTQVRGNLVSYVPQGAQNALNPLFTVEHQIADPIRHHKKISWKEAIEEARKCLELVGIGRERTKLYPHQYSGGMKQRALIALALGLSSRLVILDEPTTALDVLIQRQILNLVRKIHSDYNTTFLLISHDLGIVSSICDKIAIMYAGRIIEVSTTKEILNRPKHPYSKALLASVPRLRLNDSNRTIDSIPGFPPNLANPPPGCPFHPRCLYAVEICKTKVPVQEEITSNHRVSCYRSREIN